MAFSLLQQSFVADWNASFVLKYFHGYFMGPFLPYKSCPISWKMMTYFCNSGCSGSAMYSSISTSLFILIIFPYNFLVHWFLDLSEDVDDCWIFLFQQLVYRVISKIRDDFEKIIFTKSWRKLKWICVMLRRAAIKNTPLFWFFSLFLPPDQ